MIVCRQKLAYFFYQFTDIFIKAAYWKFFDEVFNFGVGRKKANSNKDVCILKKKYFFF